MKKLEVVAAIFKKDDKIFCAQRNNKGLLKLKWEFPGGKIESGETKEEALIRECKEELNIDINVNEFFMTIVHQYESFHLTLHTYFCSPLNEDFSLNVHENSAWLPKSELLTLDWAEADIPIVEALMK